MHEDDTNIPPAADPMAAARAAKARKALEKADAEARQAEADAASAGAAQPTVSTLRTKPVQAYEGEMVRMRVTHWGHGQISTGGEFGFERYGRGAIIECAEMNGRDLFNKRFAEPLDDRLVERWIEMDKKDAQAAARAFARQEYVLEHGVNAGENWRSATNG